MSGPRKFDAAYYESVSCAGRSILQMVREQLDRAMIKYLEDPTDQRRGIVRGLATGVAIVQQPYNPNVKAVERESKRRVAVTAEGCP